MLTVAFVTGVTLTKWTRVWAERHPGSRLQVSPTDDAVAAVRDGSADVGFVRLPIPEDGLELNVIRLYSEVPVAVLPKEHPLAQEDGIRVADLADERVLEIATTTKDAVELVAAGAGVLLVPQSIARLNNRKDVVAVTVTDAPQTTIAVIWLAGQADPEQGHTEQRSAAIDDFIGIVRGRSAKSSRGTPTPPTPRAKQSTAKPKPGTPAKRRPPRPISGKRRRTW
ncbi:MAG: LysR family substrate-binding domain-containing protein [Terrimesophilobacter sp.]